MAVETYKVDQLADRILHVLTGRAGAEPNLDQEVRWALQAAQLMFCNEVNPHSFREQFSITTVNGENEYDLPDDFHQILEDTVRFAASDFRTLREIPEQQFHRYWMSANQRTGDPESYRVVKKAKGSGSWRIFFDPQPDTDTREIIGTYRSLPTPIWNSQRGTAQAVDERFTPENIMLMEHGAIACGHFSRYLQGQDILVHEKKWQEGIASAKKNNNPVVGKNYTREQYVGMGNRGMRIPGGIGQGWWGGSVTGPAASTGD